MQTAFYKIGSLSLFLYICIAKNIVYVVIVYRFIIPPHLTTFKIVLLKGEGINININTTFYKLSLERLVFHIPTCKYGLLSLCSKVDM